MSLPTCNSLEISIKYHHILLKNYYRDRLWATWAEVAAKTQTAGQESRVQTPGYVPQKTQWVFGYTHLKKPTRQKKPHFYFNLILVCTSYATNNAIFYCFKAFKALSYWVFVLFYLFFLLVQKKPNKTEKPHWVGLLKNRVFWTLLPDGI